MKTIDTLVEDIYNLFDPMVTNTIDDKELDKQLPMPPKSLPEILINFNRNEVQKQDWNAYQKFTPEVVIKIFEDVFLK